MMQAINPAEIKAFVFDVGGVLALDAPRFFLSELAVRESLDIEELVVSWKKNFGSLTKGIITEQDFWMSFIEDINLKIPPEELLLRFKQELRLFLLLDKGLIQYLRQLKEEMNEHRKVPVSFAILSNNVKEWATVLESQENVHELFEVILYSCNEGVTKPDPTIFQKLLIKLDCSPQQVLFIDNREKNIRAAKALGMHAILYSTFDEFKEAMLALHFSRQIESQTTKQ